MHGEQITGCLIVKNEEETVERCIKSILPIIDELIIVDTGSTDRTIEIVRKYTNHIHFYQWNDNFAEVRNFAISKATKEWIIFPDADEYFNDKSQKNILNTIKKVNRSADALMVSGYNINPVTNEIKEKFNVIRIFRNKQNIKYTGRIHEYLKKTGNFVVVDCTDNINFYHTGYNIEVVRSKNKNDRNINLLLKDLEENENNGNAHYYLSQQYMGMLLFEKVQYHAMKAIENGITVIGREPTAYVNYIKASLNLKNRDISELIDLCNECIKKHPNFPDIYLLLTECYLKNKQVKDAIDILENFIKQNNWDSDLRYVVNINLEIYKRIFELLGNIYLSHENNPHKAVYYYTKLLQLDKFNELFLEKVITLLENFENDLSIIRFLNQIYDEKSINDLYYLAKQFAILNMDDLKNYYRGKLISFI